MSEPYTKREQKLVNIMFSCCSMISTPGIGRDGEPYDLTKLSVEDKMAWVADQLRQCGFNTRRVGASWGILVEE